MEMFVSALSGLGSQPRKFIALKVTGTVGGWKQLQASSFASLIPGLQSLSVFDSAELIITAPPGGLPVCMGLLITWELRFRGGHRSGETDSAPGDQAKLLSSLRPNLRVMSYNFCHILLVIRSY